MKTIFIEAKSSIDKIEFSTEKLPKKLGLVTTIQHLHDMQRFIDYLKEHNITATLAGQVLGCDASAATNIQDKVDAFLYVGTGDFHPIGVALKTDKPVFKLNPGTMKIAKLEDKEIEKIRKKKNGMLLKFHTSKTIGIISTTKSGQSTVQCKNTDIADLKTKYPEKQFYSFLCETLDYSQLDNFNFIDCWVNTMCPRIMEDIKVLNIEDIC